MTQIHSMQSHAHKRPASSGRTFSGARKPAFTGSRSTSTSSTRTSSTSAPRRSYSSSSYRGGGTSKPPYRGGRSSSALARSRSGRGGFRGERIDYNRFIKKAELIIEKPYVATHTFADFPFVAKLHENITKKGYVHPMPIQDQAIKSVLAGKDIFGLANTGTGKTAAFLLPLINKIAQNKKEQVIVLAPTRELAIQIEKELIDFARGMGIFSAACVGGLPISKQVMAIRRGVSFVIGTPGRVKDLIDRKVLVLSSYNTLVLDEADRMLDMGFREDMEFILRGMPKERQTLFFSATLSPDIRALSERTLRDPLFISVVVRDTSKNIDQDIIRVIDREKKIEQLHDVLNHEGSEKVLIFRETKRDVDQLTRELSVRGFKVGSIHGDKKNRDRLRTLDLFKQNHIAILVATDVAARGLDIPDVTHVINYDVPQTYDTYVHRIGRTGRGNKKGKALTFVH